MKNIENLTWLFSTSNRASIPTGTDHGHRRILDLGIMDAKPMPYMETFDLMPSLVARNCGYSSCSGEST